MENNTQGKPYFLYPVWDPVVRALHWWLVLTFFMQIISGGI